MLLIKQNYVNETDVSAWNKVPLLQKAGPWMWALDLGGGWQLEEPEGGCE